MFSLRRLAACIAVVLVAGCNSPTQTEVSPRAASEQAANETPPPPPSSTGGGHVGGSGT